MKKSIPLALAAVMIAVPAQAQDVKTVTKLFLTAFEDTCFWPEDDDPADQEVQSWELTWRSDYADTDSTATLYEFFCGSGAYNANYVYYVAGEFGTLPVAFATPTFDVVYENDDFDGAVLDIPMTGYSAEFILVNSTFDPEAQSISSHALWRGIGDAASNGTWVFDDGRFRLVTFDVDASYDGEIDPERLVDFGQGG